MSVKKRAYYRGALHARLQAEWLLVLLALLAIALAVLDPQPLASYRHWLQLPTLAGLMGLLIAIQGIRDSGLVQHAAVAVVARAHSLRSLGLLLVSATALLSMVLTNDVSLFLIVPLTLAIGAISNLPVLRMVVLVAAFAWLWLPRDRVALTPERIDGAVTSAHLGAWSMAALVGMVLLMEYGQAPQGALLLLVLFALLARSSLARIDWLLLLTFAAIFLGLGHFANLPLVHQALDRLDFGQPLTLYVSGIVASQLISNVPATVLLLERTPDTIALAVAVNVGGFGVAIGSLANLIALRLAKQPHGLRLLHLVSIPFLLLCAPLVYLAWRWVHP